MESLPLLDMSSTSEALKHASSTQSHDPKIPSSELEKTTDISSVNSKTSGWNQLQYASAQRRLSLALILPTLAVVLITAGAASALLAWLLVHRSKQSLRDVWTTGAFVLDEGTKLDHGNEAAKLTGLTISSAVSTAVALTGPTLMGLYAFQVGNEWFRASVEGGAEDDKLPGPVHYGLMIQLLGGGGPIPLLRTSSYLLGDGRRNRNSLLISAFVMAIVVFVLTHAISGADLWLHGTVSAIAQNTTSPLTTPPQYGIGQDKCQPYPTDPELYSQRIHRCLYDASGSEWANYSAKTTGMVIAANSSTDIKAITLADANDLSVLVPFETDPKIAFSAPTFGARATCQSVNPLCQSGGRPTPENCTGFPETFPPINDTTKFSSLPGAGESKVYLLSSSCDNCTHLDPTGVLGSGLLKNPLNQYNIWMQFVWMDDSDEPFIKDDPASDAVANAQNWAYMLANCTLSFYNVTLNSSRGSFFLRDEVLTDPGISDGFAGPTQLGHFTHQLIANTQGALLTLNSTDRAMAALSQELSRLAIGTAGAIMDLRLNTTDEELLGENLVGWYPIAPVITLLALLYSYAVLALIIFARIALFTRSHLIEVPGGEPVSSLELAAMRLTNPLTLVAALFVPPVSTEDAKKSVVTDSVKMFPEDEKAVNTRLRVGLRGDGSAFGVWGDRVVEASRPTRLEG